MTTQIPPAGTALGSTTYPHRKYHGTLTNCLYVTPEGSNSNDGLTWGSAMKDLVTAYAALPSTGGYIYVYTPSGTTFWIDDADHTRGLWIGASGTGFMSRKRVTIIGIAGPSHGSNSRWGPQVQFAGGSTSDRSKPALWIGENGHPMHFENIDFGNPAVCARLGVLPSGTDIVDASGVSFKNCSFGMNATAGNGPSIELGYQYWTDFEHCTFSGNSAAYTLTAATRAGAVATFTTSITHFLVAGDTVYVTGVTPSGYNGTWTIDSVTATTFVATLTADPGGSGTAFGTAEPVRHYRRAAIAYSHVPWTTGTAAGLINIESSVFNGGGFYLQANNTSGNITMRNITHEGDFSGPEPPTFFLRTGEYGDIEANSAISNILLENVGIADADATSVAVAVEGPHTPSTMVTAINVTGAEGNLTQLSSVDTRDQVGIDNGAFIGHHVGHNRTFSPVAVRYANLASQTLSGGSWTTGVTAPDGTTDAASLTNATANVYSASRTFNVGDWVIAGVWTRAASGTSFAADNDSGFVDLTATAKFYEATSRFRLDRPAYWFDGGWDWRVNAREIVTGGSTTLTMTLQAASGNVIAYYAPILLHIPVADGLDDQEIAEMVRHLQTYPSTAAVGDVVTLAGHNLHSTGALEIDGALNHDGTTVGFYGVTPATRPTAYTQTYATADKTHANFTSADLATTATTQTTPYGFATQAQGDNIATQFNLLRADMADLKQLVNSVIDDLQTLGILQ